MSIAFHCDGPECRERVFINEPDVRAWLVLTDEDGADFHFCTGWHMTRWGASMYEPEQEQEPEQENEREEEDDESD
jgi:hypothetical protein